MREILFKAKNIATGEWVEGWIVPTMSNTYYDGYRIIDVRGINYDELDFYEPSFISWKVDKNTICQYTGLTDKNGKKIWENDVVRESSGGYVGFVKYMGAEYSIEWNGRPYIRHDILFWVQERELEVIGNIFDNPELIGE